MMMLQSHKHKGAASSFIKQGLVSGYQFRIRPVKKYMVWILSNSLLLENMKEPFGKGRDLIISHYPINKRNCEPPSFEWQLYQWISSLRGILNFPTYLDIQKIFLAAMTQNIKCLFANVWVLCSELTEFKRVSNRTASKRQVWSLFEGITVSTKTSFYWQEAQYSKG